MKPNTLEWQEKNFREFCERCKEKLIVHAYRPHGKGRQCITYAHCVKKTCGKFMSEIAFMGGEK